LRVTVRQFELDEWQVLAASNVLPLSLVVQRAMRLYADTLKRYPHTTLASELTRPEGASRWDNPVR
jgi:hypothetical protein